MALVELKNQLISEGRYTDAVDDLLIKFVDWPVFFFMLLHTLLNSGQGLIMWKSGDPVERKQNGKSNNTEENPILMYNKDA